MTTTEAQTRQQQVNRAPDLSTTTAPGHHPSSPTLNHAFSDSVVSNGAHGHRRASSVHVSSSRYGHGHAPLPGLTASPSNSLGHTLRRTITGVKKSSNALRRSISGTRAHAEPMKPGAAAVGLGVPPKHGRSMSENLGHVRRQGGAMVELSTGRLSPGISGGKHWNDLTGTCSMSLSYKRADLHCCSFLLWHIHYPPAKVEAWILKVKPTLAQACTPRSRAT